MFVVSFVGNRGTFIRGYKAMVMDVEFLYHVGYILTSVLGLFAHELFYSILVRPCQGGLGGCGAVGPPAMVHSSPAPGLLLRAGRDGFLGSLPLDPCLASGALMAAPGARPPGLASHRGPC